MRSATTTSSFRSAPVFHAILPRRTFSPSALGYSVTERVSPCRCFAHCRWASTQLQVPVIAIEAFRDQRVDSVHGIFWCSAPHRPKAVFVGPGFQGGSTTLHIPQRHRLAGLVPGPRIVALLGSSRLPVSGAAIQSGSRDRVQGDLPSARLEPSRPLQFSLVVLRPRERLIRPGAAGVRPSRAARRWDCLPTHSMAGCAAFPLAPRTLPASLDVARSLAITMASKRRLAGWRIPRRPPFAARRCMPRQRHYAHAASAELRRLAIVASGPYGPR